MTRIFLSYRRQDSAAHAGRLYDRLCARFGKANVFIDIDAIELGEDFVERIARTVSACDVLIALIGRNWLAATDAEGRRRLDATDDIVRMEIGAALQRDIRVIPLLVGGASMPIAGELPESLAQLTRRNGLQISDARFHEDVDRLVESIDRIAPPPAQKSRVAPDASKRPRTALRKSAPIVILAVLAAVILSQIGRDFQSPEVLAPSPVTEESDTGRGSWYGSASVSSRSLDLPPSKPRLDVEAMKVRRSIDANEMASEMADEIKRRTDATFQRDARESAVVDPTMQTTMSNLGLLTVPVGRQLAEALNIGRSGGVMISEVARGSAAAKAGLSRGDVILLFDRARIRDVADFEDKIRAAGPDGTVRLDVRRLRPQGVDSFAIVLTTPLGSGSEAQSQQLRQIVDKYNRTAKNIIQSMGR